MAEDNGEQIALAKKFGSCCNELASILEEKEFVPLIGERESGVLFMAVGFGFDEPEEEEEALLTIDHPVFFCPFCGTKLQDPEAVTAQLSHDGGRLQ